MREERAQALELAKKLGITIPGHIQLEFWSLPILLELLRRIEELERKK